MRKIIPSSFFRTSIHSPEPIITTTPFSPRIPRSLSLPNTILPPSRSLAQVQSNQNLFPETWYTSSGPLGHAPPAVGGEEFKVDERTLKLGNTIQTLQSRLPTLLASPLPPEILSPHISLHLFPSTHPHLPTVSGRVAYHAALWTAPMAWGRVPIVGNVKLLILSERMVKNEQTRAPNAIKERLVVRWKTCGKTRPKSKTNGMASSYRGINGTSSQLDKITEWLSRVAQNDEEFCGLFIFEFDEEGRILTHIIEHAEECGSWDKASKVVSVTDWLLGKAKRKNGKEKETVAIPGLVLGCCESDELRRFPTKR